MKFLLGGIVTLGTAMAIVPLKASTQQATLPFPAELKLKVEFWKKVYTEYTTRQGVLHDSEDLSIVYEAIDLPKNGDMSGVDAARRRIREHLFNILRKRGENLTTEERNVLSKFPVQLSRSRILQATENIRFQLGQSDRFREGLIRSGYYLKHIEKILAEEGVPDFIKFLPHVESSFQEYAISKFGAAGLWQLMPATGRMFLKVGYDIDERLDPWKATRAAAKHLKRDFNSLKSWPLALTAYNHGPGGVRRAVETLGTSDIVEIAFRYSSPSFGFASRNFYAQFLAASEVASNYRRYFGELPIAPTLVFDTVELKKPTYFRQLVQDYRFTTDEFRRLNPGIRPPVLSNRRPIPARTIVRVPLNSKRTPTLIASIDKKAAEAKSSTVPQLKAETQKIPSTTLELPEPKSKYDVRDFADSKGWIEVEMNETISQIAEWLRVDVDTLRGWNGMERSSQVRLGQKLIVKFIKNDVSSFQAERSDYHKQIREDFFSQYAVEKLSDYVVKKGENLWSLCYQKFEMPPWLLADYNPKVSLNDLKTGTKLKIPVLKEKDSTAMANSSEGF